MKRIIVEVVADDIEKANAILRNTVDLYWRCQSFCVSEGQGSASVTVSDADVKYGCHFVPHCVCDYCLPERCFEWRERMLKRKEDCQYWRIVNEK